MRTQGERKLRLEVCHDRQPKHPRPPARGGGLDYLSRLSPGVSTKTKVAAAASFLIALVVCWLSLGVFSDREFGEPYLFLKHRLSTKFYFYAPRGEADVALSSLAPAERRAELAYEEFVERNGGYDRALDHYFRPAVLGLLPQIVLASFWTSDGVVRISRFVDDHSMILRLLLTGVVFAMIPASWQMASKRFEQRHQKLLWTVVIVMLLLIPIVLYWQLRA